MSTKIAVDSFVITDTQYGKTVRWKHNRKALKTFYGKRSGIAEIQAKQYIQFLVGWFSGEGYVLTELGKGRFTVEKEAGR